MAQDKPAQPDAAVERSTTTTDTTRVETGTPTTPGQGNPTPPSPSNPSGGSKTK